jgi:multisubunit Na+/H+ antiporter MnhE subunit
MNRFLISLVGLVAVYVLVLASAAPWDIAIGVLIGVSLLLLAQGYVFGGRLRPIPALGRRILAFFPFVLMVIWEIIHGTWDVALIVLHLRPLRKPGIIPLPIGDRTPLGIAISSLVVALPPGSFMVDVDYEKDVILIHMIDASDPDAIRARFQEFYRRYQRHVFP